MTTNIPGPTGWPIIGNMLDVAPGDTSLESYEKLAETYGPIYQLTLNGRKILITSSAEILRQVTDEKQFIKVPPSSLEGGRAPRALFAARGDDPDWGQAHRILTPSFGVLPVQGMFDGMMDIASQMCLRWARMGSDKPVLLTDDFTRLTLDTIALCAMDFRFNSFYQNEMHPFVDAMMGFLSASGRRSSAPWITRLFSSNSEANKLAQNIKIMRQTAQHVIDHRRSDPVDDDDLLNKMLHGTDPKTGSKMRDELVISNMVGFLIAGHETTSGLLSFVFMQLLLHPKCYRKAQKEIDEVVKGRRIQPEHLKQLVYLNGVLRETLRLTPTAPGITKMVNPTRKDELVTFCDGKYRIGPQTPIRVLLGKAMSDPTYFGEDAKEFNPERMVETNPNFDQYMAAWKPFGNGSRSCIGQNFAWQEALLASALVLQNFDVTLVDDNYQPRMKQALTVKPRDLYVKVKLREGINVQTLCNKLSTPGGQDGAPEAHPEKTPLKSSSNKESRGQMTVLYGSNSGTCQFLAQRLASMASSKFGFKTKVEYLDHGVNNLPTDQPVVIITSSYEGQPPDNAANFVAWLEGSNSQNLKGVKYAVFGCGDSHWHSTFHRIPKLVDGALSSKGAERFCDFAATDVSKGNPLDDFEPWQETVLNSLHDPGTETTSVDVSEQVELHTDKRASQLSSGMTVAQVKAIEVLTEPGQPQKRHMEIMLPENMSYECGDYLAVLPLNPDSIVKDILARWKLPWDAGITFKTGAFAAIPENTTISVHDVLKGYLELSVRMSKKDLAMLANYSDNEETLSEIKRLSSNDSAFDIEIVASSVTLFEYLLKHPDIRMPFPKFLSCLPPLKIRQYSISSSPLADPSTCTITYGVINTPAGSPTRRSEGVASTYLSRLNPGDSLQVSIKQTATVNSKCPFRLPQDPNVPLLMFCAGTGVAPFRGFVQHRAALREANKNVQLAPALLFTGCRSNTADRLYEYEFDQWTKIGAVDVRYAFSREPKNSAGCKYISDRMLHDRDDIRKLWRQGARVYICGNRAVVDAVKGAAEKILDQALGGCGEAEKAEKTESFKRASVERVVVDVFD